MQLKRISSKRPHKAAAKGRVPQKFVRFDNAKDAVRWLTKR